MQPVNDNLAAEWYDGLCFIFINDEVIVTDDFMKAKEINDNYFGRIL